MYYSDIMAFNLVAKLPDRESGDLSYTRHSFATTERTNCISNLNVESYYHFLSYLQNLKSRLMIG